MGCLQRELNFRERGYIVEICSFAIFKIRTLRIRIAEIAWKYSGSEFETTQLNFQIKRYIYNIYQLFTTIYNIYTIYMYAVYFRIKISFQSKHCNSVVFKFFVHIAYGFLYIILTGFPLANIIRRNWVSLNRLMILLSKCTLSSSLPKIHFSLGQSLMDTIKCKRSGID